MAASILQRVAANDESAVKECLDRYGGLVWSLARRYAGGRDDAEDAVQEIFVSLWKSAGRYDPDAGSETTFVATIARRRLIDRLRARGARPVTEPLEAGASAASGDSPERIEAAADVRRVREALAELRPEQRRVIELSVAGGYTHAQIAERTGLPLGTVKTHVRRGLMRVRELLRPGAEGSR